MRKEDWVVCLDDTAGGEALIRGGLYKIEEVRDDGVVIVNWAGKRIIAEGTDGKRTHWLRRRFAVVQRAGELREGDLVDVDWNPNPLWYYKSTSTVEQVRRLIYPDSPDLHKKIKGVMGSDYRQPLLSSHRVKDHIIEERSRRPADYAFKKNDWVVIVDAAGSNGKFARGDYFRVADDVDDVEDAYVSFHSPRGGVLSGWHRGRFRLVQTASVVYEGDLVRLDSLVVAVTFSERTMRREDVVYVIEPRSTEFRARCRAALGESRDEGPRLKVDPNAAMIERDGPPPPLPPLAPEPDRVLAAALDVTVDGARLGGFPYDPNADCAAWLPGIRGEEDDDVASR